MAKKRRDYEFERKVGAMVDALRLARALEFVERVCLSSEFLLDQPFSVIGHTVC
jgi:hypothetical protein